VSLTDARAFCKWLGAHDGLEYRLPTEEEWEFAARAGTTTKWFCGDDPAEVPRYAWFNGRNNPVGTKLPNPFGLYDIHSNVIEFTLGRDGLVIDRSGVSNFPVWFARSGSRAERRGAPDLQAGFRVVAVGDLTPAAKLPTRPPPPPAGSSR
jgi:formylglycine-generating enzyme required for sulfatase activity